MNSTCSISSSSSSSSLRQVLGPWLACIFRFVLGIVFVVASLDKLLHPAAFARSISHYDLVPLKAINLMAICLPWIELCCGLALIFGLGIKANLLVVVGLLGIFIVAILSVLYRGLDISCGCFTTDPSAHRMTRWTLYWDIIWMIMGIHALFFEKGFLSITNLIRQRLSLRRAHIS